MNEENKHMPLQKCNKAAHMAALVQIEYLVYNKQTSAFSNIILVFPDTMPFDTLKTKIREVAK